MSELNDSKSAEASSHGTVAAGADGQGEGRNIDALDLLIISAKQKRLLIGGPLLAAIVAIILSLAMPNVYTGTAVLMPPQEDDSTATAMLGQLVSAGGAGGGGGGIASALGLKNPNDLYVGILKSRSVSDQIIRNFQLVKHYGSPFLDDARDELSARTSISAGKDGLISVSYDDENPMRAAAIANAYVAELDILTEKLAISEAGRRRLYYEKRLDGARVSMRDADLALKAVQEKTGLIKPDDQAKAIFESIAVLRAQVTAKKVELSAAGLFATSRNPDYRLLQEEVKALEKQLAGLERENNLGSGDILLPPSKIPQAGLEFLEKLRDVRYHEAVYELLSKQLEMARLAEGKNSLVIQVMDAAVAPQKKTKPKRLLIGVIVGMFAFIFLLVWVFMVEGYKRAKDNPYQANRFLTFRKLFFSR